MRILALILLFSGAANSAPLDDTTIFNGDVYGTYNNLRLRATVSSSTQTTEQNSGILTGSMQNRNQLPNEIAYEDEENTFVPEQFFSDLVTFNDSTYVVKRSSASAFDITNPGYAVKSRFFDLGLIDIHAFNASVGTYWYVDVSTRVGVADVIRIDDYGLPNETIKQWIQISTSVVPGATIPVMTFSYNTGKMFLGKDYYSGSGKLNVDGNIAASAGHSYYIGSADINTPSTLSNVIYNTTAVGGDATGTHGNIQVVNDSHSHTPASLTGVRLSTVPITSADVNSSVVIATSPAGGDATGTLSSLVITDDSHNHTQVSVTGFRLSTQAVTSADVDYTVLIATAVVYSKTMYTGTLGEGTTFYAFTAPFDLTIGTITATVHYPGSLGSSTYYCGNGAGLMVDIASTDLVGDFKSNTGSATITAGTQVSCFISATTQDITPVVNMEILYTRN